MDKFTLDRDHAITWARKLFEDAAFVIFDTETTGLSSSAEIMQFAFVNHNGTNEIQFDVCPSRNAELSEEAFRVHGITLETVRECAPIIVWADNIIGQIKGKTVIGWNVSFDYRMLIQSFNAWQVEPPAIIHLANFECAMLQYAKFIGDWDARRGQYRWHKLPGATHGAIADCRAVLAVLRQMAAAPLSTEGDVVEINTTINYTTETISHEIVIEPPAFNPADEPVTQTVDLLSLVGVIVDFDTAAAWTHKQRIDAGTWAALEHLAASDNNVVRMERPEWLPLEVDDLAQYDKDTAPEPAAPTVEIVGDTHAAVSGLLDLLSVAGEHISLTTIQTWSTEQHLEAVKWAADLAVARLSELLGQPFTTPTRPAFFPADLDSELDLPF